MDNFCSNECLVGEEHQQGRAALGVIEIASGFNGF
jgi:hypothetical protein